MKTKQEGEKFQQYFCGITVSAGALFYGISLAWTSPAFNFLENEKYNPPFLLEVNSAACNWIAALMPIGAICGCLPAGFIANLLGRKVTLICFTIPYLAVGFLTIYASNVTSLYIARFVTGITIGIYCGVIPMYVTEIAEVSVRGSLGALFGGFIGTGILVTYVLGYFDSYTDFCSSITSIAAIFFVCLLFIPESPDYLVKRNFRKEAEASLRRLRGKHCDVQMELDSLFRKHERSRKESPPLNVRFSKRNMKGLTISVVLMVFLQFSGMNAVTFFADEIFIDAGVSSPELCSIIFGIMLIIPMVVTCVIIDRVGRKVLLATSGSCMALALLPLGYYFRLKEQQDLQTSAISWLPVVCVVFFGCGFTLGMGTIPWIIMGEILSPEVKSFGVGLSTSVNWFAASLVTFFFHPVVQLISLPCTFWFFATINVITTVFTISCIPETKGKSLTQIQDELAGKTEVYELRTLPT